MYRKHFGLTRHPFTKTIEPDELFPSAALHELEVRLTHLLDLRGIGVVTGESGSGKTTACRKLVSALPEGSPHFLERNRRIVNPFDGGSSNEHDVPNPIAC